MRERDPFAATGVQLYTGNFLPGVQQHTAFCLETQHYPDAVNQPAFPSIVLRPGQEYKQTTTHVFSW